MEPAAPGGDCDLEKLEKGKDGRGTAAPPPAISFTISKNPKKEKMVAGRSAAAGDLVCDLEKGKDGRKPSRWRI